MHETARVSAIVVTYNSRGTIARALGPAREAHSAGVLDCIVVDNCSRDGTADLLEREHSWVTVIRSPENLGFARGCNLGIERVQTPYFLLLNPDAELPRAGLERLVEFLDEHPRAAIVGPSIPGPAGLQHSGGLPSPAALILDAAGSSRAFERRDIVPGEAPFQTDWLSGAILMIRTSAFRELGGFDPRFFLYFEETDLCRRALDGGWEIWAVGEAVGRHVQSVSARSSGARLYAGCIAEHYFRSRFYYLVKHHGWIRAAATDVLSLALVAARCALRALLGRPGGDLAERIRVPILRMPQGAS